MSQANLFGSELPEPDKDAARLRSLLERVRALVLNHRGWLTLETIARACGGTEASCSARLRDLRKKKYGGHIVERRRKGGAASGLYEYRVRRA
jgi:hypothetical protein